MQYAVIISVSERTMGRMADIDVPDKNVGKMDEVKMAELPRDTIYHYESKDGLSITVTMTPLVRCKDCKKHSSENEFHEVFCEAYEAVKSENGYCDEGKRMDEVDNG